MAAALQPLKRFASRWAAAPARRSWRLRRSPLRAHAD